MVEFTVNVENILVIKIRYIGDVLLATSILPALTRHFPHSRISFMVNEGTEAVLKRNSSVESILFVPRSGLKKQWQFLLKLRKNSFDCVIDLTDADRSAIISVLSGAPIRIGFNHEYRWRGKCYTHCIEGAYGTMHMVDYHAKALEPLGIHEPGGDPELFLSDEDEHVAMRLIDDLGLSSSKWVMIHPAARYWFKAWPPERFAAVGDALIKKGYKIVLVGNQQERDVEKSVLRHSKDSFISLMGKTSLLELGALMKHCSVFIGNDGGPMHMAVAVGCPVVALFGPSNPAVWGPRGKQATVIYKGLDCRECFHPGCFRGEESCMKLISVDEVLHAAEVYLES